MIPPIPEKSELFCAGCQQWKSRAAIVAARYVPRRIGRQAQFFCVTCAKERGLK